MISVRAIYEEGKLRLLDPVELQEGEEVEITLVSKKDSESSPKKGLILGLHEGMAWMSDDFDEPLPDSFWFGKVTE